MARARFIPTAILALFIATFGLAGDTEPAPEAFRHWRPVRRAAQQEIESVLVGLPSAASLAAIHEMVSSRPHVAGTPGDLEVVEALAESFERLGLDVERHEFWAYLPRPVSASLEIVAPDRLSLDLREEPLPADSYAGHPASDPGWNAYSGSGEVTAEVVYVNYGTRADFERLADLDVDVSGRIVLARYGGNFRGHKVAFAERAGAAGVIIFTDPEDAGYVRGLMYPEGGYANSSYIQRGSIKVLPYDGDPLTPFVPATREAERLEAAAVGLPKIPVQPIGWGAAQEILSRMKGPVVPEEWQGALPLNYRLTGGSDLRVRLAVEQETTLRQSFNVVGRLEGSRAPDELVIIGSHHDSWGFGAGDPNAGTIVVYEVARAFAELAKRGVRPDRTVLFAHWGAEEYGIIGSVEWVEAHRAELATGGVTYINLDGAAMGPQLGVSAAPPLKELAMDVARATPSPEVEGAFIWEDWLARTGEGGDEPRFGNLGGGSDHVGFYCHLGIPSIGLSGRGSRGTAYHSNYETLDWYRKIVGSDYASALMLSRAVALMAARLANADLLPFSFERYGRDLALHAEHLAEDLPEQQAVRLDELAARGRGLDQRSTALRQRLLAGLDGDRWSDSVLDRINFELLAMERTWLAADGLPGRPWFRNLFAATDEDSGYAAWMLPALRWAIERGAPVEAQARSYDHVLDALDRKLDRIQQLLDADV